VRRFASLHLLLTRQHRSHVNDTPQHHRLLPAPLSSPNHHTSLGVEIHTRSRPSHTSDMSTRATQSSRGSFARGDYTSRDADTSRSTAYAFNSSVPVYYVSDTSGRSRPNARVYRASGAAYPSAVTPSTGPSTTFDTRHPHPGVRPTCSCRSYLERQSDWTSPSDVAAQSSEASAPPASTSPSEVTSSLRGVSVLSGGLEERCSGPPGVDYPAVHAG